MLGLKKLKNLLRSKQKSKQEPKFFSESDYEDIVHQMDQGNFNFDEQTWNKMVDMWLDQSESNPMPSKLRQIHASGDAKAWNSKESLEMYYSLPNAFAYEKVNKIQYYILIKHLHENNINFENKTIIDVGCGIATLLEVIHEEHPQSKYIAVEYSANALKHVEKYKPYIKCVNESIESDDPQNLEPILGQGDIVICSFTLEHLINPKRAIKNLLKLKKADGLLCLTIPNGAADRPPEGKTHSHHVNFWDINEFEQYLKGICGAEQNIRMAYMEYENYVGGKAILAVISN